MFPQIRWVAHTIIICLVILKLPLWTRPFFLFRIHMSSPWFVHLFSPSLTSSNLGHSNFFQVLALFYPLVWRHHSHGVVAVIWIFFLLPSYWIYSNLTSVSTEYCSSVLLLQPRGWSLRPGISYFGTVSVSLFGVTSPISLLGGRYICVMFCGLFMFPNPLLLCYCCITSFHFIVHLFV